ncbi:MAG: HlyD family efflux transporter periplasmic adaptor subunit [Chloroflexota bacterium]
MTGKVAAVDQTALEFPILGRVDSVLVKPGDVVEEGQLLLQADTTETQRELTAARARLELSTLRMEQSQAQAKARQRQAEQRIEAERLQREKAIRDAEASVRRAQEDLVRVKAGAPAAERRAADSAIQSARSAVERAEAELARASAGPSENELKAADQQVWAARLTLQKAQADFEKLKQGPDPIELRAAEREVINAQTAVDRARLDMERLVRGDPVAIASAEREVQRATLSLRAAQETRIDSRSSKDAQRSARAARDASIASAQLALRDAQDRLNAVRRGPPPAEVEMARRNIQTAESALQTARERYETVQKGPNEMALATANQAVEAAQTAALSAEARYLELAGGPPADRVAAAQDGVRSARAALAEANQRMADLNSRPTRAELQDAEDRVAAASSSLEQVQAAPEPTSDENDPAAFDLVVLQKNLEQDRAQVESLEHDLAAANLYAPFAGVVSAVLVRPGDPMDRGAQVMSLARPGIPIVTVEVSGDDVSRVAVGQHATVTLESDPGSVRNATITGLVDGPVGLGRIAQLEVQWPETPPIYGTAVQAVMTLQVKTDVLLVPQQAVRSSGQRRYVEYMDGVSRRTADVVVGISNDHDTEIIRGLREGQEIIAGPSTSATPTAAVSTASTPTSP